MPSATLHTHGAEEEQTCNANERLSFIAATAYTHRRRRGLPESPLIHPLPQTARKHPVFLAGKDANIVVEEGKRRGKILSISSRDLRGFTSTLLGTERSGAKAKESFYVEKKFSINFRTRILAFFCPNEGCVLFSKDKKCLLAPPLRHSIVSRLPPPSRCTIFPALEEAANFANCVAHTSSLGQYKNLPQLFPLKKFFPLPLEVKKEGGKRLVNSHFFAPQSRFLPLLLSSDSN